MLTEATTSTTTTTIAALGTTTTTLPRPPTPPATIVDGQPRPRRQSGCGRGDGMMVVSDMRMEQVQVESMPRVHAQIPPQGLNAISHAF